MHANLTLCPRALCKQLDEVIGYALAAAGIYTQITSNFAIFFPLNLVLFPLTLIEWILRYQIVVSSVGSG